MKARGLEIWLAAATLVGCGLWACSRKPAPAVGADGAPLRGQADKPLPNPLPEVAARVDGEPILTRSVMVVGEAIVRREVKPSDAAGAEKRRPSAYREALDHFIIREMLFQEALRRGIDADTLKVESSENRSRAGFRSEDEWLAALAQQGLDSRLYKGELRIEQTVTALVQQEAERIPETSVSEPEIEEYGRNHVEAVAVPERVTARVIFIRLPPDVPPLRKGEFRTRAEKVLVEARTGGDFEALARQHSEDPGTAPRGGLLEPFGEGELPPELNPVESAALLLGKGQVSDIIETKKGFFIVKVLERLAGGARDPQVAHDTIRRELLDERRAAALARLVERLRAKAVIETYL